MALHAVNWMDACRTGGGRALPPFWSLRPFSYLVLSFLFKLPVLFR